MFFTKNSNIFLLTTQCKSCDSTSIKFKLFDKFEINKSLLIGLTCGIGISASAYLIYKIYKFNKNLNESINHINTLTQRFECIIIDLTHIDAARIGATERIIRKKPKRLTLPPLTLPSDNNEDKTALKKKSLSSSASMSDFYETPLTSPHGSSSENESEIEEEFKDPIEEDEIDIISNKSSKPLKSMLKRNVNKLEDNILVLLEQSVDSLKELVKKAEMSHNEDETNVEKLIEYIKSLFALAERTDGDFSFIKETHYKCRDLSRKLLELDSKTYYSHKWCAITIGRIIEYLGMNEKIKASVDFKKHLDTALELNENDWYLLYMRGRWAYSICNLNRIEKYAVKLIYGDMPTCTMDNALEDFLRVERLYPKKFKGNLLYLAKCNIHFNAVNNGVENLKESFKIQCKTRNELMEHQEVKSLLDKYSNDSQ